MQIKIINNSTQGNDRENLKKHLYECLRREVIKSDKPFSWITTLHRAIKCHDRRFYFWWRIASYLYKSGNYIQKRIAFRINRKIMQKYNTEIQLPAQIAPGLTVTHYMAIVINGCAIIGENFKIRQNTTIGFTFSPSRKRDELPSIIIGDNVEIGANCCIIGDKIKIGNNVTIGAMSFINKDIPNNCTVYTKKYNEIVMKTDTIPSV